MELDKNIFNAIIEIPKGSDIKFEMDQKTGRMKIDRFINGPDPYPFNYGFITDTLSADGDALDVMVLSAKPIPSGSRIGCRPIGLLEMEDEAGKDTKILAVSLKNKKDQFYPVKDFKEIDLAVANQIRHFFKYYKKGEPGKWSKVHDFLGSSAAATAIENARKKTQENHS